jgi:hypothetical protein
MKDDNNITLNQAEIQEACRQFIQNHYNLTPKKVTDKETVIMRIALDPYDSSKRCLYHVFGAKHSYILYGTFSTTEKAEAYKKKLENSPTAGYVYNFFIEEQELDPEFK